MDKEKESCGTNCPFHCKLEGMVEKHELTLNGDKDGVGIKGKLLAIEKETILRTSDLERRLFGLNELRQEVVKDREIYLKREIYDVKTQGYDNWCANIVSQITDLGTRLTKIETKSVVIAGVMGVFFTILQLVMFYWHMTKTGN